MKWIIALALSTAIMTVNAQTKSKVQKKAAGKPLVIQGTVSDMADGIVYFTVVGQRSKRDSAIVKKGSFVYKTTIEYPQAYFIGKGGSSDALFFVEPGNFTLKYNLTPQPAAVINSVSQKSMDEFNAILMPIITERNAASSYAQQTSSDSAQRVAMMVQAKLQTAFDGFMQDPTKSAAVQAFIFLSNAENVQDAAPITAMYEKMPAAAKQHRYAIMGYESLNRATADDMGKIAPDFTLKDSSGKSVTLSQYRGKNYVLVDFWATWCGPCRAEFPALIEAQKKYASKGLVILGVSIDKDYNAWKSMLAKPNFTTWTHVWDGPQGPDQVSSRLYSVPSIPRNFLLDKNGKVIARNLRGAQVEQLLEQLVK
jgi:thiol-disulfide isomerase/thioredoxin